MRPLERREQSLDQSNDNLQYTVSAHPDQAQHLIQWSFLTAIQNIGWQYHQRQHQDKRNANPNGVAACAAVMSTPKIK